MALNEQERTGPQAPRCRHSLNDISDACATALNALTEVLGIASAHGLLAESDAVARSLAAYHAAAKAKWEALP